MQALGVYFDVNRHMKEGLNKGDAIDFVADRWNLSVQQVRRYCKEAETELRE